MSFHPILNFRTEEQEKSFSARGRTATVTNAALPQRSNEAKCGWCGGKGTEAEGDPIEGFYMVNCHKCEGTGEEPDQALVRAAALGHILHTLGIRMNGSDDAVAVSNACVRAIEHLQSEHEALKAEHQSCIDGDEGWAEIWKRRALDAIAEKDAALASSHQQTSPVRRVVMYEIVDPMTRERRMVPEEEIKDRTRRALTALHALLPLVDNFTHHDGLCNGGDDAPCDCAAVNPQREMEDALEELDGFVSQLMFI